MSSLPLDAMLKLLRGEPAIVEQGGRHVLYYPTDDIEILSRDAVDE